MKNEKYRRAFDNLNVPADMAERIRRAAAEEDAKAGEKAPAVLPFSRRKIRRARRAAAVCAAAAALGVLVWRAGLFPLRADRASGTACAPSAQSETAGSGSSSGNSSAGSGTASGKTSGTASGKTAGTASGETSGTASGKAAGKASGKAAGTASGKASGTASGKASGKASGTASGKTAGTASGKTAGTASGTAAGKASGTAAGTVPDAGSAANDGIPAVSNPDAEVGTGLQANHSTQAVSSPADLAGKLDFTPALPAAVPAGWQVLSCAAVGGRLAQIVYADGSGGEVCWRTAQGTADVSGDHTDYPETNLRGGVTYRGADGTVSAAGWTAGGAAFSLTFSPAVTADAAAAWTDAVRG